MKRGEPLRGDTKRIGDCQSYSPESKIDREYSRLQLFFLLGGDEFNRSVPSYPLSICCLYDTPRWLLPR